VSATKLFPVACVIVGAGAGTRFGEPKAGARLADGRRFVDVIAQTAKDASLEPVVAVLPPGLDAPAGAVDVRNPRPDSEQVASLRLGLTRLANTPVIGAVVWAVDHPFVTLETVLAIVDGAKRTRAPIVVPECDGRRGHPVFFHRDTWRELLTVPEGGARTVVRAYGDHVARVPTRDDGVVRNVDTRADLDDR
jgi:CTP:molybdopterin cytidylyltransferase MocA